MEILVVSEDVGANAKPLQLFGFDYLINSINPKSRRGEAFPKQPIKFKTISNWECFAQNLRNSQINPKPQG